MKNIIARNRHAVVALYGVRGQGLADCKVLSVHGDYFSLADIKRGTIIHIPYSRICHLVESQGGTRISRWRRRKYGLLIEIGPAIQFLPT